MIDGKALGWAVLRGLVVSACRPPWRVSVRGRDNVPATGACILAPSHRSMMDIPFLAMTTRRRIIFMGKREAFDVPVAGRVFRALGSLPVERDGGDLGPLKESLAALGEGLALAVYPEGTRQHGREIAPLQPGAAYLALRAGVPIVPVGIAGSEEIFRADKAAGHRRHFPRLDPVVVVAGRPIPPEDREGRAVRRAAVAELTERLRGRIQEVFDEAYAIRDSRLGRSQLDAEERGGQGGEEREAGGRA